MKLFHVAVAENMHSNNLSGNASLRSGRELDENIYVTRVCRLYVRPHPGDSYLSINTMQKKREEARLVV